ncbi:MAG TPA: cytochrome b/b6 domain-containing protein [Acidimicrobiales bacterium]|nr:cytochrome b/b6 domain-containing protein [Acidimicrobiales bacterium]
MSAVTLGGGVAGAGSPGDATIARFSAAERALHWAVVVVLGTCALTGLVLYVGPLSAVVGRRTLVRDVHVVAGLATPVPFVLAYAGRWRAALRRDVRRLARWSSSDRRWLLSRGRCETAEVGKFNAGQKANAAFIAGVVPLMVVTGSIMRWYKPFPLPWRTGATFVHDWTAIGTWIVVAGHVLFALSRPPALRSMVTGRMSRAYAEDHHPRWAEATAEREGG